MNSDVTIEILKDIRKELRGTNARLDQTNARLDQTHTRLGQLERRVVSTKTRLATEVMTLARAVGSVRDLLRDRLDVRDQVADHEHRIQTLEDRSTT